MAVAFATPAFAAYITWSTAGGNAGTGGPHQGYALATKKCAVCHSVHDAAVPNAPAGAFGPAPTGPVTELLLRSSVADSCSYCHIETNIGGLQIYGGIVSQYKVDDVYGHNGASTAECADCHSVHGANTFKGAVARKVLKKGGAPANTHGNVQIEAATAYSAMNGGDLFNGNVNRNAQISAFCTECHKVYSQASEDTVTSSGIWFMGGAEVPYTNESAKNHPLKPAEGTFSAQGATTSQRVAWLDSTYCRSCHAAGVEDLAGNYQGLVVASFPHFTPDRARFLTSGFGAADASATAIGAGNPVNDPSQDGVCLRCHSDASGPSNANSGVGTSY